MAEQNYDDPLAALPTVAPPSIRKKKRYEGELAGAAPTGPGPTTVGDDYFGNFPTAGGASPLPGADPDFNYTPAPYVPPEERTGPEHEPRDRINPPPRGDANAFPVDPKLGGPEDWFANPGPVPSGGFARVDAAPLSMMSSTLPDGVEQVGGMPGVVPPYEGGPIVEQADDLYKNLPFDSDPGTRPGPDDPRRGVPPETGSPGNIDDYIQFLLENPTRYDDEMVQEGLARIDEQLADKRQGALTDIDERLAQRGLVGSSVEANQLSELGSDLERQRKDYAFDLQREMATTRMQDMQAAGRLAIAHRANQLREMGMNMDDAYRQAALEFEQKKFFGEGEAGEEGFFPGTFAQEQYLAELDAYYQALANMIASGMSDEDRRSWEAANPMPLPPGGYEEERKREEQRRADRERARDARGTGRREDDYYGR